MWVVGIDPGFGETGVVLLDDPRSVRGYATFSSKRNGFHDLVRAQALGFHVMGTVREWVDTHRIRSLVVCIETPVLGKNVNNLFKQVRTLQAVEERLFSGLGGLLKSAVLIEVNPTRSKRLGTGNARADKDEIVRNSPFADSTLVPIGTRPETRSTLADAWLHAQSAWYDRDVESQLCLTREYNALVEQFIKGGDA